MAGITFAHLTEGAVNNGASDGTTASISPTRNRFYTAWVRGRRDAGAPSTPVITGCGITWTLVKASVVATTSGMWLFRGVGTPSAGTLTISFSGENISIKAWSIDEWANVALTGTAGVDGIVQSVLNTSGASTSFAVTLATLESASNMAIGMHDQYTASTTITKGSGFTEIRAYAFDGDDSWGAEYLVNTTNVDVTSNTSSAWNGIAAELRYTNNNQGIVLSDI